MQAPSKYREAIKNIQQMLRYYDMSFGISNKMFRMAIVFEILNVQSLFEQLLNSWKNKLPFGEGPDADIDFEVWSNYIQWEEFVNAAKQNVCIDNLSFDCGNGEHIDDFTKSFKKGFHKNLTSIYKSTLGKNRDDLLESFKAVIDDRNSILTYGEMVFYAISLLLTTLRAINDLLKHPSDEQLLQYYITLDAMFVADYRKIETKIAETHKEEKPNRKKENNLRALRDDLFNNLIKSGVLEEKIARCNQYEVQDFLSEHDDEFSEDAARIIVTIDEFGDLNEDSAKIEIARYLFEKRHIFSTDKLMPLFVYLHEASVVTKNLGYVATEKKKKFFWDFPSLEEISLVRFDLPSIKISPTPKEGEQEVNDIIETGIKAVFNANICNQADWAVVTKILEEQGKWAKSAYSSHADRINTVCGKEVTSANSIARASIYTKVSGTFPKWKIKEGEETREMPRKLEKYLQIGRIFTAALDN